MRSMLPPTPIYIQKNLKTQTMTVTVKISKVADDFKTFSKTNRNVFSEITMPAPLKKLSIRFSRQKHPPLRFMIFKFMSEIKQNTMKAFENHFFTCCSKRPNIL